MLQKRETRGGGAYLSKVSSGFLKAAHLQPLLEEVKRVRDCFADHSGSAATDQASQVSLKRRHKKLRHCVCVLQRAGPDVWAPLTSWASRFGRWRQQLFKNIVEEELQPCIGKHGHERWRQAAVKSQCSLWAAHYRHGMSQVPVHLRGYTRQYLGLMLPGHR